MTSALQVPTWPDPIDVTDFTNAHAVMFGFTIEAADSTYRIHIKVYASQAAFAAGKEPIADLFYRNAGGVFPNWNTAVADPNFINPLLSLRNWVYNTVVANDTRFTGSTLLP